MSDMYANGGKYYWMGIEATELARRLAKLRGTTIADTVAHALTAALVSATADGTWLCSTCEYVNVSTAGVCWKCLDGKVDLITGKGRLVW